MCCDVSRVFFNTTTIVGSGQFTYGTRTQSAKLKRVLLELYPAHYNEFLICAMRMWSEGIHEGPHSLTQKSGVICSYVYLLWFWFWVGGVGCCWFLRKLTIVCFRAKSNWLTSLSEFIKVLSNRPCLLFIVPPPPLSPPVLLKQSQPCLWVGCAIVIHIQLCCMLIDT